MTGNRRGFESRAEKTDENHRREGAEKAEKRWETESEPRERGEDIYNRLAKDTYQKVMGKIGNEKSTPEGTDRLEGSEVSEAIEEPWKIRRGEEYYNRLARTIYQNVIGNRVDKEPISKGDGKRGDCSEFVEASWETERPRSKDYYNRLARAAYRKVLEESGDKVPVPESEDVQSYCPEKREVGLKRLNQELSEPRGVLESRKGAEDEVKRNDETISWVRWNLCREQVRSVPKEWLYYLVHYHWFLDRRVELLEELNPDKLSDFRDKHLKDTHKLATVSEFFENNKITDIAERESEKTKIVLSKYEELLNKRYAALAGIETTPQSKRDAPRLENAQLEGSLHIAGEGWVEQKDDEKSMVKRATMSGEKEDSRFEHSAEYVRSESPLGETEGVVKRTEARVEKDVVWDEDSVRRVYFEISRIKEAYRTRTDRPYVGLLELAENVDKSTLLTVVDRGEHKWLKNVDYVVMTKKWGMNEKGKTHFEQCTQVIGHRKTEKGETDILEASVTDKARWGIEKDDKIRVETTFRFNPKITIEKGKTGERKGETKPSVGGSSGIETAGDGERQKTVLKFYRDEGDVEKPENAHAKQVIYKVIHLPPLEESDTSVVETIKEANEADIVAENSEQTTTRVVENIEQANENTGIVENLEEIAVNVNSPRETVEATDMTEEQISRSKKAAGDNLFPEYFGEEVEDKNQVESVEESSKRAPEREPDSDEFRFEDAFILVEGRGRRRIFPVLGVLDVFVEGIRRNGGDEKRYCEELRKRGAPWWLSEWLLRQMVYERRVPEDILRVALEYLGRDTNRELNVGEVFLELEVGTEPEGDTVTIPSAEDKELEEMNALELNEVDESLSDGKVTVETLESERKWLGTLNYEMHTVLILGTVFSFSLFSKPVLSKVIEAKNKSKSERNNDVLRICDEALRQFQEDRCIDVASLLTITRYIKKTGGGTSGFSKVETANETDIVTDTYSLDLESIEELLQLLNADFIKTSNGLSVLEPLEPYVKIDVSENKLGEIRRRIGEILVTIEKLNNELEKLGISLRIDNLYLYLKHTKMLLEIYLKICHILGIEVDLKAFTRWRSLTADMAAGMWHNHKNIMVLIQPDDLKKLYDDLIKELGSRGISANKFVATNLRVSGSKIHKGDQLKEIPRKGFIDIITLKEICRFLGKDFSELREMDQKSMSKKERVHLPKKVVRMLRLKIWEKYGFRYLNILAEEVKVDYNNLDKKAKETYKSYLQACLNGEKRITLELLEKIERTLGVKVKDSLHIRGKVRHKEDFTKEIIREGENKNILIEKIEVNEPDMGKRTLLTFIRRREEGKELTTEIKEIGETVPSTLILWFLNPPTTKVTVNRTREFKNGKDLLTYIIKKCAKKAGSKRKAAKILGVSHNTIDLLLGEKKYDTIILKNLLTFALYSGVKLSDLTDYIEQVGIVDRRTNPRLVIDLNNSEGAHIVMNMYGDGTFVKYGTKYTIRYENKQIDFVKTFAEKIRKVYGIVLSINEDRGYPLVSTHSPQIGHSFEMAGLTPGHKARINEGIPEWVIEGTVEMLKDATDAYLADEANITKEIRIDSDVEEPKLKKYLDILKQIKGIKLKNPQGKVLGKRISIGKLRDYEEIFNIAKNKQSKILERARQMIVNLLTKHGVSLEEYDIQIETVHINVYLNGRITVTKRLRIKSKVTEKLHEIQGGFPGYKELMYANHMSIGDASKRFPLRLKEDELEILKSIGKERGDSYLISVKKLPEELKKRHANPPQEVLDWQREYFEREVEILVDGKPVKVRGMPSRLKGEIIISPSENIISWKLVPALSEEINEKWWEIKPLLRKIKEGDKDGA